MSRAPSLKQQLGKPETHVLSTGLRCESPFHVPEAGGVMIFGSLELRACRERLAGARWRPLACLDGRALGCLWLSDFADSTCGPYQELTVTILVSAESRAVEWVNRWTPFAAQQLPGVYICEYVLVLNNRHAVAYGKELHGFDKHLGEIHIGDHGKQIEWRVTQDTVPTVSGQVHVRGGIASQARMLAQLTRAAGHAGARRLARRADHRVPRLYAVGRAGAPRRRRDHAACRAGGELTPYALRGSSIKNDVRWVVGSDDTRMRPPCAVMICSTM
jgi:hypothetical protein